MKSKQLIRFYFKADGLNAVLDNLIMKFACASKDTDGVAAAEKIIKIIAIKDELRGLWGYLDSAAGGLNVGEREVLRLYGSLRVGINRLPPDSVREIRRVTMKFRRRLRGMERFGGALKLLGMYYCLL